MFDAISPTTAHAKPTSASLIPRSSATWTAWWSNASDAFDHHAVHVAEERGIRLALVGFACAVVGEIASNNRVGRGLQRLVGHHPKHE